MTTPDPLPTTGNPPTTNDVLKVVKVIYTNVSKVIEQCNALEAQLAETEEWIKRTKELAHMAASRVVPSGEVRER